MTLVDLVPGASLVMRTAEGPYPLETTDEWQPADQSDSAVVASSPPRGRRGGP